MTRRTRWLLVVVGLGVGLIVVAALLARTSIGGKGEAAAAAAGSAATAASAAAAGSPAIELAAGDVARAERAELTTLLAVSGGLKAVHSAVIKARVSAEVKDLSVREGDRVSAGQLIGHLDATEFLLKLRQADDQASAAQAQLEIAQRTLDNNKALVDQGFISRSALDTSAMSTAGAQASLQAARAASDLARKAVRDSEVRAPIGGLVAQRLVQPGERVALDTKLVEIVDLSRIELEAPVAPEDVLNLRVGQTARVWIDGLAAPVAARIARINPSAQTGTRSVMVYLELASTVGLRQGLFARADIELQRKTALLVPVSALRFDQARPYVMAVESGRAVQRNVLTAARGDGPIAGRVESVVEITDGLDSGATVLRGTVGALRAGTPLKVAPLASDAANAATAAAASAARAASAAVP